MHPALRRWERLERSFTLPPIFPSILQRCTCTTYAVYLIIYAPASDDSFGAMLNELARQYLGGVYGMPVIFPSSSRASCCLLEMLTEAWPRILRYASSLGRGIARMHRLHKIPIKCSSEDRRSGVCWLGYLLVSR